MNYNIILGTSILAILLYIYYLGGLEPTQNEIQTLDHAKNGSNTIDDSRKYNQFPYPQLSRGFQKLGNNIITKPMDNLKKILPNPTDSIQVIRDTDETISKDRLYLPDYYRKDRLSSDTTQSSELRPFNNDNEESEKSWTDENVSKYPQYYNSNIKNELTNIGLFFDKNNRYNDKTSSNSDVLPSDSCYKIKNGEYFCEDNTRLQNIPPSLITDINKCEILNNIGVYKDKINKLPTNERTINGGYFYNEVYASNNKNETPSQPLQQLFGDCML